jgi:hypothetical protein
LCDSSNKEHYQICGYSIPKIEKTTKSVWIDGGSNIVGLFDAEITNREWLENYMIEYECETCHGARLSDEVLSVKIDKKNIYQVVGNFFIGVGPILFGSAVLMLLMWLLIPATFANVFSSLGQVGEMTYSVFSIDTYTKMGAMFMNTMLSIFSFSNFGNWAWWVFIVLGILIATHMTLSKADVDGSKLGFAILIGIFLLVDGIIYLISPNLLIAMTNAIVKFSFYILSLLMLGIIVLLLLLILTFVLGGFKLSRNY